MGRRAKEARWIAEGRGSAGRQGVRGGGGRDGTYTGREHDPGCHPRGSYGHL